METLLIRNLVLIIASLLPNVNGAKWVCIQTSLPQNLLVDGPSVSQDTWSQRLSVLLEFPNSVVLFV